MEIPVNLLRLVRRSIKCLFRISESLSHFTGFLLLSLRVMDQLILVVKTFFEKVKLYLYFGFCN